MCWYVQGDKIGNLSIIVGHIFNVQKDMSHFNELRFIFSNAEISSFTKSSIILIYIHITITRKKQDIIAGVLLQHYLKLVLTNEIQLILRIIQFSEQFDLILIQ